MARPASYDRFEAEKCSLEPKRPQLVRDPVTQSQLVYELLRRDRQPETLPDTEPEIGLPAQFLEQAFPPANLDFESKLNLLVSKAREFTSADGAVVALAENGRVTCRARAGSLGPPVGSQLNLTSGISAECFRTGHILSTKDTECDSRVDAQACRELGLRAVLAVPLTRNEERLGLIEIFSAQPKAFGDEHLRIMRVVARLLVRTIGEQNRWAEYMQQIAAPTTQAFTDESFAPPISSVKITPEFEVASETGTEPIPARECATDSVCAPEPKLKETPLQKEATPPLEPVEPKADDVAPTTSERRPFRMFTVVGLGIVLAALLVKSSTSLLNPLASQGNPAAITQNNNLGVVATPPTKMLSHRLRIVIDPGHGGKEYGAVGTSGLKEKDLVLDIARRLGSELSSKLDAEVHYTRNDDRDVPLETRSDIANHLRADVFVSIHANSNRDSTLRGVEIYYMDSAPSLHEEDVAATENASAGKLGTDVMTAHHVALENKIEQSRKLAILVQQQLYRRLSQSEPSLPKRNVKRAPFLVLLGADMPSILAEISYLSSPLDERKLASSSMRAAIADAVYHGIAQYVGPTAKRTAYPLSASWAGE